MSKKAIIISLVSVIVVAGAAVGILLWTKGHPTATPAAAFNNRPTTPVPTTPDLSKDLGACTVLKKDFIKSTLGKPADNLQGPDNMGFGHVPNDDQEQTCVYSFVTGGTIDNGFNQSNGFSVDVYVFANQANLTADQAGRKDGSVEVSGIGDKAIFLPLTDSVSKQNEYDLTVYSGLKYYNYKISEPSASATFTSDTAKSALTTIAQSVTYQ